MKLIPVTDVDERAEARKRTYHKLEKLILEFQESTADTSLVQFDPKEYSNVGSLAGGLTRAAKRLKVNVHCVSRQGRVYLIKGDLG